MHIDRDISKWDLEGLDGEKGRADERLTDKRVFDGFVNLKKKKIETKEKRTTTATLSDTMAYWKETREGHLACREKTER